MTLFLKQCLKLIFCLALFCSSERQEFTSAFFPPKGTIFFFEIYEERRPQNNRIPKMNAAVESQNRNDKSRSAQFSKPGVYLWS